jgi:hypothetical protein
MRIFYSLIAAVILCVFAQGVQAAENGRYTVMGAGSGSCGRWIEARREGPLGADRYVEWVEGYLTSFNAWDDPNDSDILDGTDIEGVEASIDNYCKKHPLSPIAEASANVISEVAERRIDEAKAQIAAQAHQRSTAGKSGEKK